MRNKAYAIYHGSIPFWKQKPLTALTHDEWELLCDGCARCCLHKFEYEHTGEIYYSSVACRFLDIANCRCTQYEIRTELVPHCLKLRPEHLSTLHFLPKTCAYRLIAQGYELLWWHPLVSGDPSTVHEAGISIRGKVISEAFVHPDDLRHWAPYYSFFTDLEGEMHAACE